MQHKIHRAIHAFFPHDKHFPKHPILKGFIAVLWMFWLFSMYLGSIGQNKVDAAVLCDRQLCNDSTDQPWTRQIQTSVLDANGKFYLWYHEYLPKPYATETTRKFPLIIFLHWVWEGGNGTTDLWKVLAWWPPSYINQWFNFNFSYNGTQESFVVLSPQAPWGWFTIYQVDALIERAKKKYRIDTERIYLMWLSAGGGWTWNYASSKLTFAKKLAAISPTCWASWPDPNNTNPDSIRDPKIIADANLPVWAFHWDADGVVWIWWSRYWISEINKYNPGLAKLTEYPWVWHNSWNQSMDITQSVQSPNVYQWFLQHKRVATVWWNEAPYAKAWADITINSLTTSVILDWSTSNDVDGSIVSYSWKQISWPNTSILSTSSSSKTTASGLIGGTYSFELTVTDDKWLTAKDLVQVIVTAPAIIGNWNGLVGSYFQNITLTSPSVNVVDKNIDFVWWLNAPLAAIAWDNFSVRWEGQIQAQYSETYTFTTTSDDWVRLWVNGVQLVNNWTDHWTTDNVWTISLIAGQKYTIKMEYYEKAWWATARLLWSSKSTTQQIVPQSQLYSTAVVTPPTPTNIAPTANAWVDKTIILPTNTATLDGVNSKDSDGSIVSYNWKQVSWPNTATVSNILTNPVVTISNIIAGIYVFELTVTDEKWATSKDQAQITVQSAWTTTQINPVVWNGNGLLGSYYIWTNFAWTTITRTDKTIKFNFQYGSPITSIPVDKFSIRWEGQVQAQFTEEYTFYTLSDDGVRLRINDIKIIDRWNNHASIEDIAKVKLVAWQKYNIKLEYYENTAWSVIELLWSSPSTSKQAIPESQLYSTNNSIPQPTPSNIAPTANAWVDQTITLPTATATLDASLSSDIDGTINSYSWKQISWPSVAWITTTTSKPTASVNNAIAGTYVFEVTVTDNANANSIDTIKITFNAATTTSQTVQQISRVLIDIGSNSSNTTSFKNSDNKTWNVLNNVSAGNTLSNMLDVNSNPTTLSLSLLTNLYGNFYWSSNGDGTNRIWYGSAILDYPILALQDSAFVDNTLTNGQWKISGLDTTKTYSFKFWGSRFGDSATVRGLKMKLANSTSWKDVNQQDNADYNNAIVFDWISGVSEVTFDIRVKDGARFGYINLVDINIK